MPSSCPHVVVAALVPALIAAAADTGLHAQGAPGLTCRTSPTPGTGPMIGAAVARDGAVWTVDRNAGRLLRLDAAGAATVVHAGAMARGTVSGVARGPGEAIWYLTTDGTVGRLDADGGAATEVTVRERVSMTGWLRRAPDGSLWFLDVVRARIGHVAPDGTVRLLEPTQSLTARGGRGRGGGAQPMWEWPTSMKALAVAPDGALWIASPQDDAVFRVLPGAQLETRKVTLASPRAQVLDIDVAPDGTVWLALGGARAVARIAPGSTTAREFPVDDRVEHVLAAADGGAWFATMQDAGHVAADGTVRRAGCARTLGPLVAGPDGTTWSLGNQTLARLDTATTRVVTTAARRVEASTTTVPARTEPTTRRAAREAPRDGTRRASRDPWAGQRETVHPVAPAAVDSALATHADGYVVVLVSADDDACEACAAMHATYDSLAFATGRGRQHYLLARLPSSTAVEDDPLAGRLGVRELPTLIQYFEGRELTRIVGARSLATLKQLLGFNGW